MSTKNQAEAISGVSNDIKPSIVTTSEVKNNIGILDDSKNERKVLVIYTGGTIGMMSNKTGALSPKSGVFEWAIRTYPQLHDPTYAEKKTDFDPEFLVLPRSKDESVRILYRILEYETLLDSSNLTEKEWGQIARDVMNNYDSFDGFVILHGTDTLCYTASALSFMFENLGKCIILTGAQIPIFEPRSDGADNFVSSLTIAGYYNIPEVTIFFDNKLFRGNRTRKMSTDQFYAFHSPNYPPLVDVGIEIEVHQKLILKPSTLEKCRLHELVSKDVGILRIFPSMSSAVFRAFCQEPIEGVILETYGAGNIPSNRPDLLEVIKEAIERQVIFVNITQCNTGSVSLAYETGKQLEEFGVVLGYDMTPEAALTKLSYVLSFPELSYAEKKEMMAKNLRGELTKESLEMETGGAHFIEILAKSLNVQPTKPLVDNVFCALLRSAVENNDRDFITRLIDLGADINVQNTEGYSVLHKAVLKGNYEMVKFLLQNGANVHLKTRFGEPPILTAVRKNDIHIIELLRKCGADLKCVDGKSVSEMVFFACKTNSVKKLKALEAAGACFDIVDELKQTPLGKAVLCNSFDAVQYLVSRDQSTYNTKDVLGYTALQYAEKFNRMDMVCALQAFEKRTK